MQNKTKYYLNIDTSFQNKITVQLVSENNNKPEHQLTSSKSDRTVVLINNLFKKTKIDASCISKITVNPGPGSYTGIRVGLAIAKTLSLLLGIPVTDSKGNANIQPIYSNDKYI